MDTLVIIFAAFGVFFLAALGAVLILWIAMPFSVFGMKDLLRKSLEEQKKANKLLKAILETSLYRDSSMRERDDDYERENTH